MTMIPPNDIQRLKALPIEQVAEAAGLPVKRHWAICPFHADSRPSLHFSTRHNAYRCFSCDAHGGPLDLIMHHLNLSFPEACAWLAQAFGIYISQACHRPFDVQPRPVRPVRKEVPTKPDIEFLNTLIRNPVLNAEARRFLFQERRLHPAVVRWCGISSLSAPEACRRYGQPFYDAPSLLIPYRDTHGRLMSVQSRYLGHEAGKPRFRFPRGSRCHVFGLPVLRRLAPGEELWIAEGVTDCLALLSSGRKAIAIPSATLLKPEDTAPLQALNLHMYPDNDEAGERLFLHLREHLPGIVRHPLPPGCKDFGQWWQSQNVKMLNC